MKMCTSCGLKPGVVQFQTFQNGESHEERLCVDCARKSGVGIPDFNLDNILNMIENIFDPEEGKNEEKTQSRTLSTSKIKQRPASKSLKKSFLDDYCFDLTESASLGEIDPIIGRNLEIDRVIHVLNRRTKNNPVLIGEPGVGKTAIAEGLAQRIVDGNVPEKLLNKKVLSLDITSVTAGTMYRGMFEERMKKIAREIEKRDDIILFIDELHMIMGAGSSMESNIDAANILKPYLARGKMQLIGATTLEEYRKIEKDSALERRFQMVQVDQPTLEDTVKILKGLQAKYEEHHGVKYTDEAIEACARLADRYISDRFMPDKAIDLMDEVGSELNLSIKKEAKDPTEISLESKMNELHKKEKEAANDDDYPRAMEYRQQKIRVEIELDGHRKKKYSVKLSHIESVVEKMTGIPVSKIDENDKKNLKSLADQLSSNVIGQTKAVEEVVRAVKRKRVAIRKTNKPVSFLFSGPTGVGKTELTKQIARELFGSEDSIIRFDMSEYMEEHSVSKLIGSPPGYVGHEEAGQLTEKVRRKPYSVILLDEIEKAHRKVLQILLQIFDDGRLTDSHGKTVDFSNTMIIMTSNLGASAAKSIGMLGDNASTQYEKAIHDFFPPELINRIDKIVPFNHLKEENILKIVDLMLADLQKGLDEKGIKMEITEDAKKWLSEKGYSERFGARFLARTITSHIEDPMTDLLIENENVTKIHVKLDNESNTLKLTV